MKFTIIKTGLISSAEALVGTSKDVKTSILSFCVSIELQRQAALMENKWNYVGGEGGCSGFFKLWKAEIRQNVEKDFLLIDLCNKLDSCQSLPTRSIVFLCPRGQESLKQSCRFLSSVSFLNCAGESCAATALVAGGFQLRREQMYQPSPTMAFPWTLMRNRLFVHNALCV